MKYMTNGNKKKKAPEVRETRKPFLTGGVFDENTVRRALGFAGTLVLVVLVSFIVCASAAFSNIILRVLLNSAVIFLVMLIVFNNGSRQGAEDVSRGEIIYQKKENGQTFSPSEQNICFHPFKGFLIGILGTLPILAVAIILAASTSLQMTGSGALPSWMQAYTRRSDIGNALISYTHPEGMALTDYVRAVIRVCILPFVNIVGSSNKYGILILERISPIILLIPAAAYGCGYLSGKSIRTKIHTAITENNRKRVRTEKRNAAKRRTVRSNEPEQLN